MKTGTLPENADAAQEIPPGCPVGTFVGPYCIQNELGRGFSSIVYLAADPRRGRAVALKLLTFPRALPSELQADLIERFRREARAVAGLTHPHIVAVYDVGQTEAGQPYLVLERLCGQSLRERLRSAGRLPVQEALPIALRVAEALDYAHGRGIIHRDVKPDNIFLSLSGRRDGGGEAERSAANPKLMDFGIARTLSDQELTRDGLVVGSPAYMAPEQISSEPVDGRTDVFSLAVTLAEMLTGTKPFEADTVPAVMQQILHSPPRLPELDNPRLERVLRKAMAKRAAQRYRSAGEFADALRRVLPLNAPVPSESTQFARIVPPLAAGRPRPSARGVWLGATALLGVALGVGTARLWPTPPVRTAAAAVRTTPQYHAGPSLKPEPARPAARTAPPAAAARLPLPAAVHPAALVHPVALVHPAVPAARLASVDTPAPPKRPAASPAVRRILPQRPQAAALMPPGRRVLRLQPLVPSPPVVVPLASAEAAPPVVRVSESRQEAGPDAALAAPPVAVSDTQARLISRSSPRVPPGVATAGEQVKLHLSVNRFGDVTDAEILETSGSDDLDSAALDSVGDWVYAPATHSGRPVRSETDVVVMFPAR